MGVHQDLTGAARRCYRSLLGLHEDDEMDGMADVKLLTAIFHEIDSSGLFIEERVRMAQNQFEEDVDTEFGDIDIAVCKALVEHDYGTPSKSYPIESWNTGGGCVMTVVGLEMDKHDVSWVRYLGVTWDGEWICCYYDHDAGLDQLEDGLQLDMRGIKERELDKVAERVFQYARAFGKVGT